jgi:hypothetical protein
MAFELNMMSTSHQIIARSRTEDEFCVLVLLGPSRACRCHGVMEGGADSREKGRYPRCVFFLCATAFAVAMALGLTGFQLDATRWPRLLGIRPNPESRMYAKGISEPVQAGIQRPVFNRTWSGCALAAVDQQPGSSMRCETDKWLARQPPGLTSDELEGNIELGTDSFGYVFYPGRRSRMEANCEGWFNTHNEQFWQVFPRVACCFHVLL